MVLLYIALCFVCTEFVLRRYLVKSGLFLVEFPKISKSLIAKYKTFDNLLGWKPKESSRKADNNGSYTGLSTDNFYTIDARGSRTFDCNLSDGLISTYGDSFCMCREVSDNETIQYFLSKQTNTFVHNYGVGNYGLDQALLRLESTFIKSSSKNVIMIITPWTISRIISIWKHYIEPGNILAAKPRFILQNCELTKIENFIQNKEQFLYLKKYKKFLRSYDENYKYFCEQKNKQNKLAIIELFRNKLLLNFIFNRIIIDSKKNSSTNIKTKARQEFLQNSQKFLEHKNRQDNEYLQHLYTTQKDLLYHLLNRFVDFCSRNKTKPYLVLLPAYTHVSFINNKNQLYQKCINNIVSELSLSYIDMFQYLSCLNADELKSMYVDIFGHHSSIGNEYIANILYNEWFK